VKTTNTLPRLCAPMHASTGLPQPSMYVPYGGNFHAMNEFGRTGLGKLVDGRLDLRCALYGYQHGDIMLARR